MAFEAEFVETETKDGVGLTGLHAEAGNETVILHLHGMQGNFFQNSFTQQMLEKYPENNVSFLTAELRGAEAVRYFEKEGESVPIGNAYEKFEDSIHDIEAWIKFLQDEGYKKIHLQGHSLACSKIAYYLTQREHKIESAILITPSDMAGFDLEDEEGINILEKAKKLQKNGRGHEIVTEGLWGWAYLSADTVVNFFDEGSNLEIFNFAKSELGFETLENIEIPTLAFFGTDDDGIVTPAEECVQKMTDNIGSDQFNSKIVKGAEHSYEGYEETLISETLDFVL